MGKDSGSIGRLVSVRKEIIGDLMVSKGILKAG